MPLANYSPIWHITGKDFGPRLGFAYSLPHQMVVRGGYGISYYAGQFDNINILQLNPPDDPSFSLFNGNCGYCTTPNAPTATLAESSLAVPRRVRREYRVDTARPRSSRPLFADVESDFLQAVREQRD